MLERATACLKSGAFRESLRRTRDVRRSKRMLHSTFWSHRAGDLDLPPWATLMGSTPSDLPLKNDDTHGKSFETDGAPCAGVLCPEGPFLDFLYPPPALAWLRRRQGRQARTWEASNARKLRDGCAAVSRGYASDAYRPFGGDGEAALPKQELQKKGPSRRVDAIPMPVEYDAEKSLRDETPPLWESENLLAADWEVDVADRTNDFQEPTSPSPTGWGLDPHEDSSMNDQEHGFADFPGDLAHAPGDRTKLLRSMIMSTPKSSGWAPAKVNLALPQRAWAIYESLDDETKNDSRLKQELLSWLAAQDSDAAITRCRQLYRSIPKLARTSEMYQAMLSLHLRRAQFDLAQDLHREALEHLENGYVVSRALFQHAVDQSLWQLAADTAVQHNYFYWQSNQNSQIKVFWLHVSEMPQLFIKATELARHFVNIGGLRSASTPNRVFCLRFFKEAISQEFLRSEDHSVLSFTEVTHDSVPRPYIRLMFQHVIDMDTDPAKYLEKVMLTALQDSTRREYSLYHHVFSHVYKQYCQLPNAVPSEKVLFAFLQQIGRYTSQMHIEGDSRHSITTARLVKDWKAYHERLSCEAVTLLLGQYARFGQVQGYEQMLAYQQEVYPDYNDQKTALWTRVYLHARRSDLDSAQQAFSQVRRLMGEHGERPDLRCWNVLLHAHMRVDDLEGAMTNFYNIIRHAKLQPDSYTFSALSLMFAQRGDVEGLESLLQQYDTVVGERRTTSMMRALMLAHFNNGDDARAAERLLHKTIAMRQQGEIFGSLTPCFNALMGFYAVRRDINATMRIYRMMRQEKARLDGDTFGALMLVLCHYRQPGAAASILRKVMPEHKVVPNSYHYSILMTGLTNQRLYQDAVSLYQRMIRKNQKPSPSTIQRYLKAKARLEQGQNDSRNDPEQTPTETALSLDATLQELREMLTSYDTKELEAGEITSSATKIDHGESIAMVFESLIYVHGARQCFEAVESLFERYKQNSDRSATLPIRLLSALMSAQWHAGEHTQVEEYWKIARQHADDIARSVQIIQTASEMDKAKEEAEPDPLNLKPFGEEVKEDSDDIGNSSPEPIETTQPDPARTPSGRPIQSLLPDKRPFLPRPSPGRRDILNLPLKWYLKALTSQSRLYDAIKLVSGLLTQGYTLTKRTWNLFIRSLLETRPPLALLAFVLTERFMMQDFPGWDRQVRFPVRPVNRAQGLERLNTSYIPRNQVLPEYLTLVRLGSAMLDLRRLEATGGSGAAEELPVELRKFVGSVRDVRRQAAKTVYAIQSMPAVPDNAQRKYLSREDED